MQLSVDLKGFRELERALAEDLPKATARNVLKRTAVNSMTPLEQAAKRNAPVEDGKLRDSITTKPVKATRQAGSVKFETSKGVAVATGPTGRLEGGNAAWQEFGRVNMAANPFMRPALDGEAQRVIDNAKAELTAQVGKAKARIAKKAAKGK